MPWVHVVAPLVIATTGIAAGASTLMIEEAPSSSAVWIDAPFGDRTLSPGLVSVTAHASAKSTISALELVVDEVVVETDSTLDRSDSLVLAEFAWQAEAGIHEVVVRQVGGASTQSAQRTIVVHGPAVTPAPEPSVSPSEEPTETSTPTPEPSDTSEVPVESDGPPTLPTIGPATYLGDNRVSTRASCGNTFDLVLTITDADEAYVEVVGLGRQFDLTTHRLDSWQTTIESGYSESDAGTYRLEVTAMNGDGVISRDIGRVSIESSCL